MGLIKAAASAIGSTFADQWKEAIRCEDMGNDILMIKKTTKNGEISSGSTVIVGPSQCAIIYDNGKILDISAEQGVYTFEKSSTPSIFAGEFGGMFKEMWQRFTYGGARLKEQAVYFFNLKEIMGNKFGTKTPVLYKDWGHPIMNPRVGGLIPMAVHVRCFGNYTFKITNPLELMNTVAGVADVYRKTDLIQDQMTSEIMDSFQNVMNGLGSDKYKIEVYDLPSKTDEIKQIMNENVFDESIRRRGISLVSFVIESVSLTPESEEKINKYEIGGDTYQQQGVLTDSYANAVQIAAGNAGGAANGFMGIGMMNMGSGGIIGGAAQAPWQQQPQPMQQSTQQPAEDVQQSQENMKNTVMATNNKGWECPNCHGKANGNFCPECGTKKPENTKKFCTNCGKELNKGSKFCPECGTKVDQ